MKLVAKSTFIAVTVTLGLLSAAGQATASNPVIGFYPTLVECLKAGDALESGPLAGHWHCHAETDDWTGPNSLYAGR
ncbi:hypothetical protein ACFYO1_20360 [Nocardia sp. NPDC006044]|uniref:hypothetical protein n=1 Tax=Nocardia sp. NPDC006044 TaxID=3364306 RepID=UPI0036A5CA10